MDVKIYNYPSSNPNRTYPKVNRKNTESNDTQNQATKSKISYDKDTFERSSQQDCIGYSQYRLDITKLDTTSFGDIESSPYYNLIEYQFDFMRASSESDDPIDGMMQKYAYLKNRLKDKFINNSDYFESAMQAVNKAFESAASVIALKYEMAFNTKTSETMPRGKVLNDVKQMFFNARDYYNRKGNLNNITPRIITGNSTTLTYEDVVFWNSKGSKYLRDSVEQFSTYYRENKEYYNSIVSTIQNSPLTDLSKKLLIDNLIV